MRYKVNILRNYIVHISLLIFSVLLFSCNYINKENPNISAKNKQNNQELIHYENEKIGLKYILTSNYKEAFKPIEVIDLTGKIKKIKAEYLDSINGNTVIFNFYPVEIGEKLFNYKKNLFNNSENNNKIKIAGTQGLLSKEKITKDGKGNELNHLIELIKIDFYNKDNGYVQIIIKSKKIDTISINKILSKIEFITKKSN
jgi:hypothetical protein